MPRLRPLSQFLGQRRTNLHRSIGSQYHSFAAPFSSAAAFQGPPNHHNKPLQHDHQKRMYHINLADDSNDKDNQDAIINADVDDDTMARHNTLSRRLYRILLRSCKQGAEIANRGNSIDTIDDDDDGQSWILLQPPMDQRKYGFAKIVQARRGKGEIASLLLSDSNNDDSSNNNNNANDNANTAASKMSKEDVGMAMEVLRFVHMSLGGDSEDDLEGYYLG
eukprot:CAMPEP_0202034018 /NCGR_PEP_ID=MMETSP0905-20130828/66346_1 /ASSEMBLY_ACC=CAM_ASM_000554 /TAXON_ID=420261 /ORGANISM="Thalassiosira antarctica, Strain CCMP982" /LENGTH=220 /DNA_ID=CAMNT_0048597935 /DNA_START=105 /DNA_END=763 /DNA_ORIENTATION=+